MIKNDTRLNAIELRFSYRTIPLARIYEVHENIVGATSNVAKINHESRNVANEMFFTHLNFSKLNVSLESDWKFHSHMFLTLLPARCMMLCDSNDT